MLLFLLALLVHWPWLNLQTLVKTCPTTLLTWTLTWLCGGQVKTSLLYPRIKSSPNTEPLYRQSDRLWCWDHESARTSDCFQASKLHPWRWWKAPTKTGRECDYIFGCAERGDRNRDRRSDWLCARIHEVPSPVSFVIGSDMCRELGLAEHWIPDVDEEARCNIFLSNIYTANKLLLILQNQV